MRIYPRGKRGILWVDVTIGGRRVTRSSGTTRRAQAEEWAAKIAHDTWRARQLEQTPSVTWAYAVLHWLRTHGSERRSIDTMKDRIRFLTKHLEKKALTKITADAIDKLLDDEKPKASLATRNRYMSEASKILHYAHRKGWLPVVPIFNHHCEQQRSVRWITGNEAATLINELPVHLCRMARFALATGLREANVRLLRWDQIDLNRSVGWIEGADMKAGKPLNVPLNADAMEVLRECRGDHGRYVFVYEMPRPKGSTEPIVRTPVTQCSSLAWYKAVKRAGLTPLRWHDLRHTWASWHVQNGTPLPVLQQLGGWASYSMVLRYAHLGVDHTAAWVNNSLRDKSVTSVTRNANDIGHYVEQFDESHSEKMGWLMGLEPTTTGITIRDSTN